MIAGGRYVLIFTALLPTMALVRQRLPCRPHRAQRLCRLARISVDWFFYIAAIFWAVITTILAIKFRGRRMMPVKSSRRAAEATSRGMVTAAAWSPFFVAFAIGSFAGECRLDCDRWPVTSMVFALLSLQSLIGPSRLSVVRHTSVAGFAVVSDSFRGAIIGIDFDLTAISAVVVVMLFWCCAVCPLSVQIKPIMTEVDRSMKAIADDNMIIGRDVDRIFYR